MIRTLRHLFLACVLTFSIASSALAGDIWATGSQPPPPPPDPIHSSATAANTQSSADDAASSFNTVAAALLSVLGDLVTF